jgi:DNA-binding Lrp family transcriptional regulator
LVIAYILAKIEAGKDEEVLQAAQSLPGVKQATPTYGVYDLHIEVTFDNIERLDEFIFNKIRRIPGVKETVTLIAFKRDT